MKKCNRNSKTNGEFKIQIIQHGNWEIPFNVIHSKSAKEAKNLLIKILYYYTHTIIDEEVNEP